MGAQVKPLTPAQKKLVEQNRGLARKFVNDLIRRSSKLACIREDLTQTAMLGIMRASQTRDPSIAKFSVHAWPWMRGFIALAYGRDPTAPVWIPNSDHAKRTNAQGPRGAMPFDHSEDRRTAEHRIMLAQLFDEMRREHGAPNTEKGRARRERDLDMVVRYFVHEQTLQEIGDVYGVSRENVRQRLANLLDIAEAA